GAALPVLHGAGLAVLSEESGLSGDSSAGLLAVIDPVDGSTNAHRGRGVVEHFQQANVVHGSRTLPGPPRAAAAHRALPRPR
ncbi:MAG: hypothetical protein JO368_10370, partial [Acidimicrobiales bacterium]|nr:hypothetical protein [Acidimicrobiales bacterium]